MGGKAQPTAAAFPTVALPRVWHFTLPFIPPGVNHQYRPTERNGRKVLTEDAKALREHITVIARRAGFEPDIEAEYGVRVTFTFGAWTPDIDGPIKALLDAVFRAPGQDNAWDHRIVRLEADKRVERGQRQTDVTVWEVSPPPVYPRRRRV